MSVKDKIIKIVAEGCRLLIGVVFIFSGFVKAIDPVGFAIKINDYLTAFGTDMLKPLSLLASFNLSAVEFTLGVCMFLGVYRRYTSFLVLLFMAVMTPLTLYLAIFDPVSDCGCFGEALVITNWQTFYKNIVLLAASVFIFIYNQRLFQVFSFKVYWFVALFSYVYSIGFSYYNYNHLPLLDFRPYKIGANIPELMSTPEGAPEDEYKYIFIYEKGGVKKEFTLEDYPANDSTWTFVDTKTELLSQGYVPEIESFTVFDKDDEDVSDMILHNSNAMLLLIIPKLEDSSDERIDEINNVYDYALEHQVPFYAITGSSADEIGPWNDITGAEYPFLHADDVLLKTIIRSNPGLVLLRDGVILMKWHYNDIPEEEEIGATFDKYLTGNPADNKRNRWIPVNILGFTLPLLFVWIYDFFRFRRKKMPEMTN